MKKLAVLFLCGLLFLSPQQAQPIENENKIIIDTIDLPVILTDNDIQKIYIENPVEPEADVVELTYEEAQLLMKVARAEGGPGLDGQLWAMRTILNRVYHSRFDNTIQEVVSEENQFVVYGNGSYLKADVNANTHLALAMIEGGWDETEGALYWESDTNSNHSWHKKNLDYITTVEGNRYYKYYEQ